MIVGFGPVLEMNLVPMGTNEFFPNSCVSLQTKGTGSPARKATRIWGDAIKAQCPLSSYRPSRGDPFPAVFVMEAAENRVSHDLAVLDEGMSILTLDPLGFSLPRVGYRRAPQRAGGAMPAAWGGVVTRHPKLGAAVRLAALLVHESLTAYRAYLWI